MLRCAENPRMEFLRTTAVLLERLSAELGEGAYGLS
jgi:hypothetical protein